VNGVHNEDDGVERLDMIGIFPVTSGDPPDQQKLMQPQNKLKTKNSGMSKEVKRSWLWTEFKNY
jgi:hypothetical protein